MINLELIKTLYPCEDRLENYIKHYGDKSFTKKQFMNLTKITHEDKLWVAFRLMTKKQRRLAVADMVEDILPIFEKSYPNNKIPRQTVNAIRKNKVTKKIVHAADAAVGDAVCVPARAVGDDGRISARAVAYVVYTAAVFASNASAIYADASADYVAATVSMKNKSKQKKFIRTIILKHWR